MHVTSRRLFARKLGVGVGAALVARPGLSSPVPRDRGPIRLSSNENPYGPSAAAREAMTQSQDLAALYPFQVRDELARLIAEHHGFDTGNIALGCGSTEILRLAAMAFLDEGRELVVAEPTFEAVLRYAQIPAARPVKVPLTADYRHDLEAMAARCSASTGLVYVCNPNNPTGTIVRRAELLRFIEAVPETVPILIDEAYHDFVEDPGYPRATEWIRSHPNVVVARTFSKIHGLAGMRLGFALASPSRIASMKRHLVSGSANVAVLEAARASLVDEAHVAEQARRNNETRRFVVEELEKDGLEVMDSHTSFVMVRVGNPGGVRAAMKQRGILVGRDFPPYSEWLRVSIGTPPQMEAFMVALREWRGKKVA